MVEIALHEIKKRSITGIVALTSRTALIQLISSFGFFLLTVFLDLKLFGVFIIVQAASGFLNYFSDIGLAGALIQKKEKLTKEDLRATFTVQQILVLIVSVIAFLLSGRVAELYGLSSEGVMLFRALILAFIMSSLKTIPSILLERKLEFHKLIISQLLEVITFYLVAIYFAWSGWGIRSLTYGVVARAFVGLVSMYFISPWMPRLGLNKLILRKLLTFGIPLQANSFLGLAKDDLFILYLGTILPLEQLSLIGWAKKWADTPLRLIMDSFIKVTFPTYSRLQDMRDKLRKGINKSALFSSLFIFPMAVGLVLLMRPLIFIIPKYAKWEPALFPFYLFVFAAAIASISTPLTNALNAVGKVTVTLKLMMLWVALTWGLGLALVSIYGYNGVAISAAVIGLTVFLVVWVSKKHFSFQIWDNIKPALLSAIAMGVVGLFLKGIIGYSIVNIVIYGLVLSVIYFAVLWVFFRGKVVREVQDILRVIRT